MLPPIPYLDLAGYERLSRLPPTDLQGVEQLFPGFIQRRILIASSWVNARLAKRYAVPLGVQAPPLVAVGTAPPPVALQGRPTVGSLEVVLQVLEPGPLGTATFWWSLDGGETWTFAPTLAPTGTSPPAVTVTGEGELDAPTSLLVDVTTAGALGTARFVWSADGGVTWNLGAAMAATGTTPPGVSLAGTSTIEDPADLQIQITTAGPLGTALFQWSQDGGVTWTTGLQTSATPVPLGTTGLSAAFSLGVYAVNNAYAGQGILATASYELGETGLTLGFPAGAYAADNAYTGQGIATAAAVVLGGTGLTALFPAAGSYAADNVYSAPTPVQPIALGWVTAIVDVEVWGRRGTNTQDPQVEQAVKDRDAALAEIKEAADSEKGLFDLPVNDQTGGTAIQSPKVFAYTEASPFVAADRQEREALHEDARGEGTFTGTPSSPRR